MKAYIVRVRVRVQRAGYRRFVLDVAQEMGLIGHVVNERDGSVTIFAQGEDEVLKGFLDTIKEPPWGIVVRGVDVDEVNPEPELSYFEIRFGSIQEELQEGFGSMEREFKDYREEFRDYREEFRGFSERTDKNFAGLEDRYGEISEKLSLTLETLRAESAETRAELKRAVDNLVRVIEKFIETVSRG